MDARNTIYAYTYIKTMYINNVIKQCRYFIETGRKFLLILDIDDTVLSALPTMPGLPEIPPPLVDPKVRDLISLVYTHRTPADIIFCTARACTHRVLTLNQLNNAKLVTCSGMPPYKVLHAPNVDDRPTKCNTIYNYLVGNEIALDTHIIVVDDDYGQTTSIYNQLNSMQYRFTIWHYIAAWAKMNQEWVPERL